MPEPGEVRPKPEIRSNEAGAAELALLRDLLLGREIGDIAEIQQRLDDPARRSAEIARILPEAVKGARPKRLSDSLEPAFEKSFHSAVRKHPKELADAIYPVIGPALRNSIAAAIREFAEGLNQIVEKSASFRALRWRVEARVTGKPYTEILLARSLLYSVEQVFLIHRSSGLLLQHAVAADKASVIKDADMISGMLTAIQEFVSDSFAQGGQHLETVDAGRLKLWIQYGPSALLVGAVSGSAPVALRDVFRRNLEQIHELLAPQFANFKQDDVSVFDPARPYLEACLLGQYAHKRRKHILRWVVVAALIGLAIALAAVHFRREARWDRYVDALKSRPGIVVTRAERRGPLYVVGGLKDPDAPDPADLAREQGVDPGTVTYEWQPYLSLNSPFSAQREMGAASKLIENQIVRFETGSGKLPLAEANQIESVASAIKAWLRANPAGRIAVTGHTDESGTTATNSKLSLDRAREVMDALVAQGVPADRLDLAGVGNTEPLRTGGSEWDRASNRGVSFRLSGSR